MGICFYVNFAYTILEAIALVEKKQNESLVIRKFCPVDSGIFERKIPLPFDGQ